MRIDVVSVIPEVFGSYLSASILGRAQANGIFEFFAHDLRDWTFDNYKKVDDEPFGGGPGMLMKVEPIFRAVEDLTSRILPAPHVVFFAPSGSPFCQDDAKRLSGLENLLLVCGRYEGMDERVYELADDVFSLGDYVLTGAELPAMSVIDACVRLLPGALGDDTSALTESFSDGLLEYAQYTRPAEFEGRSVPEILLSGNHAEIASWRRKNSLEKTLKLRPDLLEKASLSDADRAYIDELKAKEGV